MGSTLAPSRKRARVFYGWWVVAAAFLALTLESGVDFYGFGVFLKAFISEFHWSRAETAAAMSIYWLTQALLSPIIGGLVAKYGCRKLMTIGAVTLGVAFLFLSRLGTVWQLYAGYVLVGVGASSMTLVPAGTAIANWFSRRRGAMTGVTYAGLGFGGVVVPPILSYINLHWGWRTSYLIIALVILLVVLPVVAFVIRTRPEEKGLLPDGEEVPAETVVGKGGSLKGSSPATSLATAQAYTMPVFWLLSGGFLMASLGTLAIATHLFAFLTDLGWPVEASAAALSLTGFLSMVGKLFFGNLSDRVSACYVAIMCFALQGVGLLLVMSLRLDLVLWIYVTMYGLGMGGIPALRPLVVAEVFGIESFATLFGLATGISTLGSVLGPLFAGYIFDITGKYDVAFVIFAVTFALAIGALGIAKRRSRKPAVDYLASAN